MKNEETQGKCVVDRRARYALLSIAAAAHVIGGSVFSATLDVFLPPIYWYTHAAMQLFTRRTRFFQVLRERTYHQLCRCSQLQSILVWKEQTLCERALFW